MGHRELKRVPLNFNWPLNKIWKGYLNPYSGPKKCSICDGTGYNEETKKIADNFYDHEGFGNRWVYDYGYAPNGLPTTGAPWRILGECYAWHNSITQDEVEALVKAGRLWDFTRVPRTEEQFSVVKKKMEEGGNNWLPYDNGFIPSAEEVNVWNQTGIGHDALNRFVLIETRAKRLGVYGKCPKCKGKGESKLPRKMKKRYKKWEEFEPPAGDGWQLWKTVSEGSPISPVFETAEALADWCEEKAYVFADEKTSKENWLKIFLGDDCDVDTGSMFIGSNNGYCGALVNMPA